VIHLLKIVVGTKRYSIQHFGDNYKTVEEVPLVNIVKKLLSYCFTSFLLMCILCLNRVFLYVTRAADLAEGKKKEEDVKRSRLINGFSYYGVVE
jgi:hypothetical protein